jgi:hypothetical protein
MAPMTPAQGSQAAKQQVLQAQREEIVRELDRINREIAEAQRQLGRVDPLLSAFAQQPGRVAA